MDPFFTNYTGPSSGQGGTNLGFGDPFEVIASLVQPESPYLLNRQSEYLSYSNGTFFQALARIASYFITDIEISGDDVGQDEKDKYYEYLHDEFFIRDVLRKLALDFLVYGNSFSSILMKFRRYLKCPKCSKFESPLQTVHSDPRYEFNWSSYEFHAKCPICKFKGNFGRPIDRRGGPKDIFISRWINHDIEIAYDQYSGEKQLIWKIDQKYRKQITEGRLLEIANCPYEIIQAIRQNLHFRFAKDTIFHMVQEPTSGVRNMGYGIPWSMTNWRQLYYCQILLKANEVLANDFVIPFRILSPPSKSGDTAVDPLSNLNMSSFTSRMNSMIRRHRKDLASIQVSPFPVQYSTLGGDAKNFAPKDLLDQGFEMLLNGCGIPVELFKGTLQLQSAPAAIRLFEAHHAYLPHYLNKFLAHLSDRLAELLSWQKVKIKLQRPNFSDDLSKITAQLQLASGSTISKDTALRPLDINYKDEIKKMLEEERMQSELQQEFEEQMNDSQTGKAMMQGQIDPNQIGQNPAQAQQQGQNGQAQGGGQGGADPSMQMGQPNPVDETLANLPQGDHSSITPDELWSKANTLAQKLFLEPDSQRKSDLMKLKQKNKTLHSAVRAILDQLNQEASRKGRDIIKQQQGGQTGGQQGQQSPQ